MATEGGYVYEAPGETHTLVVEPHVAEMITLFQVNGVMIYVDPDGAVLGYEDVFTKIDLCRTHYGESRAGRRLCRPVHPLREAAHAALRHPSSDRRHRRCARQPRLLHRVRSACAWSRRR